MEVFSSRLEKELFSFLHGTSQSYKLTKEEWKAMRDLAEDQSMIIKPADKGSCVVIWDRKDYLTESIANLKTTIHTLTLRSLIKNLYLTLLKIVTEFLWDCAIRNLSQKKNKIV